MPSWSFPLDPDCPEVEEFRDALWSDPMTSYSGVGAEVEDDFATKHRTECERCLLYGAANVEVV